MEDNKGFKRYLLFAAEPHDWGGGMLDFVNDFEVEVVAKLHALDLALHNNRQWEIYDTHTRKVVDKGSPAP